MLRLINNYKNFIIALGVLLLVIGTWLFFNGKKIDKEPDRAELVISDEFVINIGVHHE